MAKSPSSHSSYKGTRDSINSQLKTISQNLEDYISLIESSAKEGINEVAQEIYDRSVEICPVEYGDLIASAYIEDISEGNRQEVAIGYRDEKAPFVHSNGNRGHDYKNPTTPNTHWQFLLAPASEVESEIAQRIANAIKEQLK